MTDPLTLLLAPLGLRRLGDCPDAGDTTTTLIGPDEPAFWRVFQSSGEYQSGQPDPMDRWSRRVIGKVAAQLNAEALFPFGGPHFAPFFTWAKASGRFWASPIGFLVHDEAGLLVSFRGAIRWTRPAESPVATRPCVTCAQPCADACPVGAFNDGYDVAACKAHVLSAAGTDCRSGGCIARRACPVGKGNRLPAQAAFHMEAFL